MRRQRQRLLQASRTHSARLSDQLLVSNPYPQTCPFLPCPASRTYPCPCLSSSRSDVRSEEHTSELQSLMRISYAGFCLKQKSSRSQYPTPESQTLITIQHYIFPIKKKTNSTIYVLLI